MINKALFPRTAACGMCVQQSRMQIAELEQELNEHALVIKVHLEGVGAMGMKEKRLEGLRMFGVSVALRQQIKRVSKAELPSLDH